MPFRNDDLGTPVPFGGSSQDKIILEIDKSAGGTHLCNVFPKGRYDLEEGALLTIIGQIGEGDKGTEDFIKYWVATSAAEGGLRVGEFIQLRTGMISPSAMPVNPGMKLRFFGRDGQGGKQGKETKTQKIEDYE